MLKFLGFKNDGARKSSERETDGFVIIGETVDEQRQKIQSINLEQHTTNVIVQPSKPSGAGSRGFTETTRPSSQPTSAKMSSETHAVDATPALPELLGDIPFTLAPHILAMQAGLPFVTDITLPHNINDKLTNFRYDFTLENSVLCEP
ncbi:UBAP1-MVB12-associated (UMA)-domain containing protein 1-like [Carassius auratus]|uniref:UBAP1-MVB12-associated (UMA)-domain containing protein 1-like n=1 Tax=Carassius auratus TaxID=7957 RepID=A0A6P6RGB4_CARAU|nr:UBAP1-MVB12-associated (UMA)-domain containing protein 1-like [Carassius auratus]XP_026144805.1 UBAP1-MVB12-associated (UMA)-domain containing protein 1-like [Carassius auratus]XP_052440775.1 UBAP1-MVB12-associated (UMA)-domain containing protein 1 isoform X1 [Carassius gibelio]XP_052440777.1 UBAP1-MVB12-associated (UMA)-domain containing protein 1 isoform X1 [Carassius gibelio]